MNIILIIRNKYRPLSRCLFNIIKCSPFSRNWSLVLAVDVRGINPTTGEVKDIQVGRQNKNGTPVARERRALDDIEKATGQRPIFIPYN